MTPAKEKATAKAAQAAVAGLSPGDALKSASLPATSKKRKHSFSTKQVGRSDNSAGDRQQRRDANHIVDNVFAITKGNPARLEATLQRVVSHAALQEHLPAELTAKHAETQQVAMQLGMNLQKSYKATAAKGSAATGAELNMRRAAVQMVLTGNEAENKQVRPTARFFGQENSHDVIGKQSRERSDAVESGDLTKHASKRRKIFPSFASFLALPFAFGV